MELINIFNEGYKPHLPDNNNFSPEFKSFISLRLFLIYF